MTHSARITLEKLFCRDTESIHSSDHLLVLGAVEHDGERTPFVVPGFRLNDFETHVFPAGHDTIFEDRVESGEVKVALGVWDVDSNDWWVDNRQAILELAGQIAVALSKANPVAGGLFAAVVSAAATVIEAFVGWDENDPLLAYEHVVQLGGVGVLATTYEWIDVPFYRHQSPDYSGFDYTLSYQVASTWSARFPDHSQPEATYQPDKASVPSAWIGDWVGEGVLVSITRTSGEHARFVKGLLDVTVAETIGTRTRTTTTTGVTFQKDLVGPRRLALSGRRRGGEVLVLDPPFGAGADLGGLWAGDQYGGDHLVLDGDASLEMYRMVVPATPTTTPALRYRRPVSRPLRLVDPTGKDLMLHPKSNFG